MGISLPSFLNDHCIQNSTYKDGSIPLLQKAVKMSKQQRHLTGCSLPDKYLKAD